MHAEAAIRRVSVASLSLALVVQVFVVIAPPQPTLASSANDMISGGVSNRKQLVNTCTNNVRDYRTILQRYGISCDDLSKTNTVRLKSTAYKKKLYSMGRLAYGKAGETAISVPGVKSNLYLRYLWAWDSGAHSTYKAFKGTSSTGKTFFILYNCGNPTFIGLPKPVEPKTDPPVVDVCSNKDGIQTKPEECDVCPNKDGIQTSPSDCDVCPNIPGVQTDTNQCDVCPDVPGTQSSSSECDVCPTTPGVQSSTSECDLCPNIDGIQTTAECDVCPNVPGEQSSTSECDVCPNLDGIQTSQDQCDVCPNVPGVQTDAKDCDICPNIDGVQTSADECDVCPNVPGVQSSSSECDVCPDTPGVQSTPSECDVCPNIPGAQTDTNQCDVCPDVPGTQSSSSECDVCPKVPGTQTDPSQCKPCDGASDNDDVTACLVLSKNVKNATQNIANAHNTTAQPGDLLEYRLDIKNTGQVAVQDYFINENISDVLDYADVTQYNGSTKNDENIITWPAVTIEPGDTVSKTFIVQVKQQLPATPASSSDPGHYDMKMTNVYGNSVTINLPPPTPVKAIEVATVQELPNTGPSASIATAFVVTVIAGYFFARSRLMAKELDIVRADFAGTGGI
ncbi:hypothetical protein CR970_00135 [Candidatus Saccharibacteria bacterium]|nr:MAG: hypothetical protein CR970_00135 [Candidatus Saccharibacteria bacterium]